MTNKIKKMQALKKLMEMVQDDSMKLYNYHEDPQKGGKYWPVDWEGEFKRKPREGESIEDWGAKAANRALICMVDADLPSSVEQMKKEKGLVQLLLAAGANPNAFDNFCGQNVFDAFLEKGKTYLAVEIAKTEAFTVPQNLEKSFDYLKTELDSYAKPALHLTSEEVALKAQKQVDHTELIYTLFQKGFYPNDPKVFEKLGAVVLAKDPKFFIRQKQKLMTSLAEAETPFQIYLALKKGNGKA